MRALVSLALLMWVISGCQTASSYSYEKEMSAISYPAPSIEERNKQTYLDAINEARAKDRYCGKEFFKSAKPLKWNSNLYKAAFEHVVDMSKGDFISFLGSGTQSDWSGVERGGIKSYPFDRAVVNGYYPLNVSDISVGGGNIDRIKKVVSYALDDVNSCKELMSDKYDDVAVAVTKNVNTHFVHFWSIMLGKEKN